MDQPDPECLDAIERKDGEIHLSSRYNGSEFRVVVNDNGKGISEEKLTRIFERSSPPKWPGVAPGWVFQYATA
jgi:sensor histidine kinase regulating citrate/malate metabolism